VSYGPRNTVFSSDGYSCGDQPSCGMRTQIYNDGSMGKSANVTHTALPTLMVMTVCT